MALVLVPVLLVALPLVPLALVQVPLLLVVGQQPLAQPPVPQHLPVEARVGAAVAEAVGVDTSAALLVTKGSKPDGTPRPQ